MARTKQTARKSSGGKAPRKNKGYSFSALEKVYNEEDEDSYEDEEYNQSIEQTQPQQEQQIEEEFALSKDRDAVIAKLIPGSPSFFYYSALNGLNKLETETEVEKLSEIIETTENYLNELLKISSYQQKEKQLRHRFQLMKFTLSEKYEELSYESEVLQYLEEELKISYKSNRILEVKNSSENIIGEVPSRLNPDLISESSIINKYLETNKQKKNASKNNRISLGDSSDIFDDEQSDSDSLEMECEQIMGDEMLECSSTIDSSFISNYLNSISHRELFPKLLKKSSQISDQTRYTLLTTLLSYIKAPLLEGLIDVTVAELTGDWSKYSISSNIASCGPKSFGYRHYHSLFSLDQLLGLQKRVENIIYTPSFIQAVLRRLNPVTEQIESQLDDWDIAIEDSSSRNWRYQEASKYTFLQLAWAYLADLKIPQTADSYSIKSAIMIATLREELKHNFISISQFILYLEHTKKEDVKRPFSLSVTPSYNSYGYGKASRPVYQQQSYSKNKGQKQAPSISVHQVAGFLIEFGVAYSPDDNSTIKDYLCKICLEGDEFALLEEVNNNEEDQSFEMLFIKKFSPYFNSKYLVRQLAETMLLSGDENSKRWCKLLGLNNSTQFSKLSEKQQLYFDTANPTYFHSNNVVNLDIWIKNSPRIIVQVYELNAFSYYQTNKSEISDTINLDGIVANYQQILEFDHPPLNLFKQKISLPSLSTPRHGVFVVEIVGGSQACRAIVRKGKLSFFETSSPYGQLFTVFDEDGINVTDQATILLGETQYKYNKKLEKICVPFYDPIESNGQAQEQPAFKATNCILSIEKVLSSNDDLAILTSFNHRERSFTLVSGMFVDSESLIPGTPAKILIRPKLYINNSPCSLSYLKKINLTMTESIGDPNAPKVVKTLDNLSLSENLEYFHEFFVDHNTESIEFTLSADVVVPNVFEEKEESSALITARKARLSEVQDKYHVSIGNSTYNSQICTAHLLRNSSGEYQIRFLGRSGEAPYNPINVTIQLKHIAFSLEAISVDLQTDPDGYIHLGTLESIEYIKYNQITWYMKNYFHLSSLPVSQIGKLDFLQKRSYSTPYQQSSRNFTILTNTPFSLPFCEPGTTHAAKIFLSEIKPQTETHIRFLHNQKGVIDLSHDGFVTCTFDEPGTYLLSIEPEISFTFTVVQGVVDGELVWTPEKIYQLSKPINTQILTVKEDEERITAYVKSTSTEGLRVHLLSRHFLTANISLGEYLSRPPWYSSIAQDAKKTWTNYLASKLVSQEYQYILYRRNIGDASLLPGNNCPRPSLLLNPFKLDSGTTLNANVNAAGDVAKASRSDSNSNNFSAQLQGIRGLVLEDQECSTYAPFLKYNSVLIPNLSLEKVVGKENEYLVTINRSELPSIPISELVFCAIAGDEVVNYRISPKHFPTDAKLAYKDMRLSPSQGFNPILHLSEKSSVVGLQKAEKCSLNSSSASKMQPYDTIGKYYGLLDCLSKHKVLFLEYLRDWHKLSLEEKIKHYSTDVSHELNLFIFFKDRNFFDLYLQPNLLFKKDKQFIDNWLLNNDLSEYLNLSSFLHLNVAERCLLAMRYPSKANHIARHVQELYSAPKSSQVLENIFNVALASTGTSTVTLLTEFREGENARKRSRNTFNSRNNNNNNNNNNNRNCFVQEACQQMNDDIFGDYNNDDFDDDECDEDGYDCPIPVPSSNSNSNSDYKEVEQQINYSRSNKRQTKKQKISHYKLKGNTHQLAEKNYHDGMVDKIPNKKGGISLNSTNGFYLDFINYIEHRLRENQNKPFEDSKGFLSPRFIEAEFIFSEMMFILAVTDLPFDTLIEHVIVKSEDETIVYFTAGSSVILFCKEIRETNLINSADDEMSEQSSTKPLPLTQINLSSKLSQMQQGLVVKQYIYESANNQKVNYNQLEVGTIYSSTVTLINTSDHSMPFLNILLQIPSGSIPIGSNTFYTKSVTVSLEGHGKVTYSFQFYFLLAGNFTIYPSHVSHEGYFISCANDLTTTLVVLQCKTQVDTTSWSDVSARGTNSDVILYLENNSIHSVHSGLDSIENRMRDHEFYVKVLNILRDRFIYHDKLWKYSFFHKDKEGMKEYLSNHSQFKTVCGLYLNSSLLSIAQNEESTLLYQHIEFDPLIHPRAHSIPSASTSINTKLLNQGLHTQYSKFLSNLCFRSKMNNNDILSGAYYYLVQDRVLEAVNLLSRINDEKIVSSMQFDYMKAYIDLSTGSASNFKFAREISAKYLSLPSILPNWKSKFQVISDQLQQFDDLITNSKKSPTALEYNANNNDESSLEVKNMTQTFATIQYANILSLQVNYYLMDVEAAFSFEPFAELSNSTSRFSYVRPNFSYTVPSLDPNQSFIELPIAKDFVNLQFMLEVVARTEEETIRKLKPHFCCNLAVQFIAPLGVLSVTDSEKNLPVQSVYVKVFSLTSTGVVRFYKDGYTDFRGVFEYASLNQNLLNGIEEFSLLIYKVEYGSSIHRIKPPVPGSELQDARLVRINDDPLFK